VALDGQRPELRFELGTAADLKVFLEFAIVGATFGTGPVSLYCQRAPARYERYWRPCAVRETGPRDWRAGRP
jgi:hypothetical protein